MNDEPLFTDHAVQLISRSTVRARQQGRTRPDATDFLASVSGRPRTFASFILDDLGVGMDELRTAIDAETGQAGISGLKTEDGIDIVKHAGIVAQSFGSQFVGSEHLFLAALKSGGPILHAALTRCGSRVTSALVRAEELVRARGASRKKDDNR